MNKVEKMEQALDAALSFIGNLEIEPHSHLDEVASELRDKILDARAMPKRQCDVGTAEDQSERFKGFCNSHMYGFNDPHGYRCKEDCPVKMQIDNRSDKLCIYCQLVWEQMPYEEGGDS